MDAVMLSTPKISSKVFLFHRVKKKTSFFGQETYPVQIRFTAGSKSIYLKSFFFELLKQEKYQAEGASQPVSVDQVIQLEETLLYHLLGMGNRGTSLQELRARYYDAAFDLLGALDESFKAFLVNFFMAERLPAYASFIRDASGIHSAGYLMAGLTGALHEKVLEKLHAAASATAPPYLPFLHFFTSNIQETIPVFPAYRWREPRIVAAFTSFLMREFPDYDPIAAISAIDGLRVIENPGIEQAIGHPVP